MEHQDKDYPLIQDIRLLGQILGDTVREQEGDGVFQLIETIRQLSVAISRRSSATAADELDRLLRSLKSDDAVSVIRAFTYFSLLANIAEDRHHIRRREAHEAAGERAQPGSLERCFERLDKAGVSHTDLRAMLDHAWVSPVLTAHPTEVQRKSILDAEHAIAALIAERDTLRVERDLDRNLDRIRAHVAKIWQTRLLRTFKLRVEDEIENALSYYRITFLREIPEVYGELEALLPDAPVPSFFRMGSWIGGDRDGNPFVTAPTLRTAFERQSDLIFRHYLDEVYALGSELSISAMLAGATPELFALAAAAHDSNPHQTDEPYRQALTGIRARLDATSRIARGEPGGGYCGTLRYPAGLSRRSSCHRSLARRPSRRGADPRAAAPPDPCRRCVRLSSGDGRSAPEFGQA